MQRLGHEGVGGKEDRVVGTAVDEIDWRFVYAHAHHCTSGLGLSSWRKGRKEGRPEVRPIPTNELDLGITFFA